MSGHRYRVLHVCNDTKFLNALQRFEGPPFENRLILAGPRHYGTGRPGAAVLDRYLTEVVDADRHGLRRIVAAANDTDLVVLHNLDALKAMAAVEIDRRVAIGWFLFGWEIYSRRRSGLYTERTREVLGRNRRRVRSALAFAGQALDHLRRFHTLRLPFEEAVERIDLLFGGVPHEYEDLERRWGSLPEFLRFPIGHASGPEPAPTSRENVILIGNSRSPFNNHLDVLDAIVRSGPRTGWRYVVPFSYGSDGEYAEAVRARARDHGTIELLEEFIPRDRYGRLFDHAAAAVYNSYRQMALWNILAAVAAGVKVYIPDANPVSQWFRSEGIGVHDVESFPGDLEAGDLELAPDAARANRAALIRLVDEYTYEHFRETLAERLDAYRRGS